MTKVRLSLFSETSNAIFSPDGTADLSKVADIASVAGLLKLYLRELPEPLFVFRFYSTFLKIASTLFMILKDRN